MQTVNGLPTYGNWGGPGWSASRETNGQPLTEADLLVDGLDPLDEAFKAHDSAYEKAGELPSLSDQRIAIARADLELIKTIYDLDMKTMSIESQSYRALAVEAFVIKLSYDGWTTISARAWENFLDLVFPSAYGNAISDDLGTTPDPLVKTIRYVDPLILDLDGDGIEITPLNKNILFDADGDGIKTGTAWAGADDGLLVWDRNGNGRIDSGAELFGDETVLADGTKAAHGFAALAELDGNADGIFNASDTQYTTLRLWRDLNQDGISQAGELQTLADTGVQSIRLSSTATSLSNGDAVLVQNSTYTRTDGATGQAGSFDLAQNGFAREFTTALPVSDTAQALPDFKGSGWVRDLREAATLSPELITLANQAKDAPTRAGYKAAVAQLMREWGNDSTYDSASKQALVAGYGLILSEPQDDQERGWLDTAIKASEADRNAYRATLSDADRAKFDAMRERMVGGLEKLHAYEAFTGFGFLSWSQIRSDATAYTPR